MYSKLLSTKQRMQNLCKCIIHILTSWNNLTFQQDGAVAMEETHIRAQTKVNSWQWHHTHPIYVSCMDYSLWGALQQLISSEDQRHWPSETSPELLSGHDQPVPINGAVDQWSKLLPLVVRLSRDTLSIVCVNSATFSSFALKKVVRIDIFEVVRKLRTQLMSVWQNFTGNI